MASVLIHRLLQTALILFGVAAITFTLLYALPADPARMIAGRSARDHGCRRGRDVQALCRRVEAHQGHAVGAAVAAGGGCRALAGRAGGDGGGAIARAGGRCLAAHRGGLSTAAGSDEY